MATGEPRYAFCEPSWQTGTRWHIREVVNGALYPNGGIPAAAGTLCGLDLGRGWDVPTEVAAEQVAGLLDRNRAARSPNERAVCDGCAREWQHQAETAP